MTPTITTEPAGQARQAREARQAGPATDATTPGKPRGPFRALAMRLHFYAGVFIGPFLLIAALSGALYALTPALEEAIYSKELRVPASPSSVPLADQIRAAQQVVGGQAPAAVRPAPRPGDTTRIMFTDPALGESESRAIFINPADAEVRGDLTVYGTSGVLPFRTWIDDLHRTLLLGNAGRLYSELAASWLWVIALAGLALWLTRPRRKTPKIRTATETRTGRFGRAGFAKVHGTGGVVLILGFLFLSATGLTWSGLAGNNITSLRSSLNWTTPKLPTTLDSTRAPAAGGEQPHHDGGTPTGTTTDPAMYDHALAAARQEAIIDAGKIEIKPPAGAGKAWTVTEIDRSWPTQADAVAIDPATMKVTGQLVFEDFNIAAKLTRWGIDAHMGVLFGLANQLVLALIALGLAGSIIGGYLMWWKRRPTRGTAWAVGRAPARRFLRAAPWPLTAAVAAVGIAVGGFVPLLGISLAAFLAFDIVLGLIKNRHQSSS